MLTQAAHLRGLAAMNRELLAEVEGQEGSWRAVLVIDSTEIPVYGEQEESAYNGRFESTLFGSLAFAFCSFVWSYLRNLFDGVLCMGLLAGAMLSMMQFGRTKDKRLFLLATTLFAFGAITRLSMVLPLVAFGVYLTMVFWQDRIWSAWH